jgi:hypothetical protein
MKNPQILTDNDIDEIVSDMQGIRIIKAVRTDDIELEHIRLSSDGLQMSPKGGVTLAIKYFVANDVKWAVRNYIKGIFLKVYEVQKDIKYGTIIENDGKDLEVLPNTLLLSGDNLVCIFGVSRCSENQLYSTKLGGVIAKGRLQKAIEKLKAEKATL